MSEDKKNGVGDLVAKVGENLIKFDWLRGLIFKAGGRKVAALGIAAYAVIRIIEFVGAAAFTVGHGIACAGLGLGAGGVAFAVAWEDKKKKENADA